MRARHVMKKVRDGLAAGDSDEGSYSKTAVVWRGLLLLSPFASMKMRNYFRERASARRRPLLATSSCLTRFMRAAAVRESILGKFTAKIASPPHEKEIAVLGMLPAALDTNKMQNKM